MDQDRAWSRLQDGGREVVIFHSLPPGQIAKQSLKADRQRLSLLQAGAKSVKVDLLL